MHCPNHGCPSKQHKLLFQVRCTRGGGSRLGRTEWLQKGALGVGGHSWDASG